eukprot:8614-Heterococcus_DN1.PRE.1
MAQDASEGLWQSLLREASIIMCDSRSAICSQKLIVYTFWVCCAQAMRKNRVPDSTLIVVGANKCGKRTLLAHLQISGAPDSNNSASHTDTSNSDSFRPALAYSFIDAKDPAEAAVDQDDSPSRVSVWCSSGLEFESMLSAAIDPKKLLHTVAVLTLDLSRPWELATHAHAWLTALERHFQAALWCYTTCRAALLARLEATSSSIANTADSANNTAALHAPSQDKLSRNKQLELQQARRDLLAAAAAKTQSHSSSSSSGGHVDSDVSPPRSTVNSSRGSLLGSIVPLVVVCCKCDAVQSSTLEQQQQALYVQQWLRGLCLDRG